jgi:hypothetical protein
VKILFIGGPADGEWREVEYLSPEIAIPHSPRCPTTLEGQDDPTEMSKMNVTIYRLEKLQDAAGRYYVCVYPDSRCVLRALLEGYKPCALLR